MECSSYTDTACLVPQQALVKEINHLRAQLAMATALKLRNGTMASTTAPAAALRTSTSKQSSPSLGARKADTAVRLSKQQPPAENETAGLGDSADPPATGNSKGRGVSGSGSDQATTEALVSSTWCASGVLAHGGGVCCDKTCGQCGGDDCGSLPGGAEHCCLAIIRSMAVECSSYTDTACLLPT